MLSLMKPLVTKTKKSTASGLFQGTQLFTVIFFGNRDYFQLFMLVSAQTSLFFPNVLLWAVRCSCSLWRRNKQNTFPVENGISPSPACSISSVNGHKLMLREKKPKNQNKTKKSCFCSLEKMPKSHEHLSRLHFLIRLPFLSVLTFQTSQKSCFLDYWLIS